MNCDRCHKTMKKVNRYIELDEPEYELTDGQQADYLAALESGDTGEWDYGVIEYECTTCGSRIEVIDDNVKDYDGLIRMWHGKAKRGDYFSRFVFEYIAFNAYLKSHVVVEEVSDRRAIQRLKQHETFKSRYLTRIEDDETLANTWNDAIKVLKKEPLLNSSRDIDNPFPDRWWNCANDQYDNSSTEVVGVVHTVKDWANMVELWYGVRNNLFHGGKCPNVERDQYLVKHAYITLEAFMSMVIPNMSVDLKMF